MSDRRRALEDLIGLAAAVLACHGVDRETRGKWYGLRLLADMRLALLDGGVLQ